MAAWLLRHLSNPEDSISLLGDSTEEYSDMYREKGKIKARCWYWLQVLISLPSFCTSDIILCSLAVGYDRFQEDLFIILNVRNRVDIFFDLY